MERCWAPGKRPHANREVTVRAVVQRVTQAKVQVHERVTGTIERGLLVLLSVGQDDAEPDLAYMVEKIAGLRVFSDDAGKMNLDVAQAGGSVLLVSQFTLHGDVRKGKRPSFTAAMAPEPAQRMVDTVARRLRERGLVVAEGEFGADMQVSLVNDGPVTLLLDSKKTF
jgi:D-tyrosyl-tRNA(Tyr) deacylase